MQFTLTIFTYLFDMFIVTIFFKTTLLGFKKQYTVLYGISLLVTELLLYFCQIFSSRFNSTLSFTITVLVSMLTSLLLSIFLFQVLVTFGESVFTRIFAQINADFMTETPSELLYNVMNIGSKVCLFLFVLILSIIPKKETAMRPPAYSLLLFTTPLVTIIIFLFLPLKQLFVVSDATFYDILFLMLVILNIINYILIQKAYASTTIQYKNEQMEQQLNFQKEKFEQLSESYRQSRRIIHDIKKQYFCIDEYISKEQYDRLKTFTSEAIHDMESTYSKYNTGNLVIDSFLTNYDTISRKKHIEFIVDLNVDFNRIPINDYDLCVILGNMLDNCMNACEQNTCAQNFIHICIETTTTDKFIIHFENTTNKQATEFQIVKSLYHGYGLDNIEQTVKRYYGFFSYRLEDTFFMDVMIPIIEKKQRVFQ